MRIGNHRGQKEAAMRSAFRPHRGARPSQGYDALDHRPDLVHARLALLWIMKGLSAWAVILGIWTPSGHFEIRSTGYQATIVYFALIDLIAAVGLWMA